MKKFTLFEVHLDDAAFSVTNNAPGAGTTEAAEVGESEGDIETDETGGCPGASLKRAALAVALLGALAAAAWALSRGDEAPDVEGVDVVE
jgi:hypothetical protein